MTTIEPDVPPVRVVRVTVDQMPLIEAAEAIAARHFALEIERPRYISWLATCPGALFVALNQVDDVIAYADVFPIETDALDALLRGKLMETELEPKHLLSPSVMRERRHVDFYVAGIAARMPGGVSEARAFMALRTAITTVLSNVANGGQRTVSVFAVAATVTGSRLIRSFDGELVTSGGVRRDGMDCYRLLRVSSPDGTGTGTAPTR